MAVGACLAVAAPAQAGRSQESIFQDDRVLLNSGPQAQTTGLDELDSLGVDTIHSLVFWHTLAPSQSARRKPRGFNAADPGDYPAANWDKYDDLVRGARSRGMQILFSPTGFTPRWAAGCRRGRNCEPSPKEYGNFVRAIGRRYSGTYRDENQGGGTLPKVTRWSYWNEPTFPSWISPQFRRGQAVAAQIYRDLVVAGEAALRRSGHSRSKRYLGELAPLGKRGRYADPVTFLREFFCLNTRTGRRLTGAQARSHKCAGLRRFRVHGVTHHPYNRGAGGPTLLRPRGRGDVVMSTLERLEKVLDEARRARKLSSSASKSIYFTEYGVESNPPDTRFGVPLAQQAEFINQADYVSWKRPRVKGVSQYELVDEPGVGIFNTGLKFVNGQNKPSYDAYRLPIWVYRSGGRTTVWGQVRPNQGTEQVTIQQGSGTSFTDVKTVTVSGAGYFTTSVPSTGPQWRLRWTPKAGGGPFFSRAARVGRR